MLSSREVRILYEFIKSKSNIFMKDLVNIVEVSERMIRYDLDKIDDFLVRNDFEKIVRKHGGELELKNKEKVLEILEANNLKIEKSQKERTRIFTIRAGFSEELNLARLCEEFDISRSAGNITLKLVKEKIAKFDVSLIPNHKKGLRLFYSENNLRRLQLNLIRKYYNKNDKELKAEIKKYISRYDLKFIKAFLNHIQKLSEKVITDEAFFLMENYILISIIRMKNGNVLSEGEVENYNYLLKTEEYSLIKKSIVILEAGYGITIPEIEMVKYTDYFIGSHSYNLSSSYYGSWVEINDTIKTIIENVGNDVGCSLINDKFLLNGLINHIKPAIHRLKNNLEFENSIYEEVIEKYPKLYEIIKKNIKVLENTLEKEFSPDEVAFILIHFKGAIERNKIEEKERKRVLIVCNFGYGTSILISQYLAENYNVEIIDTIPFHQLEKYVEEKEIDYIVTTMERLEDSINIPVIRVNSLLDEEDIELLNKKFPIKNEKYKMSEILELIKNVNKSDSLKEKIEELKKYFGNKVIDDIVEDELTLKELLEESSIKKLKKVADWKEAIRKSGEILYEKGYIDSQYIEDMIQNIEVHGTYIVNKNGVALPHAKNRGNVKKTSVGFLVLDEKILFPGNLPVDILISIASKDEKEHIDGLLELVEKLRDRKRIDILKKKNENTIYKELLK